MLFAPDGEPISINDDALAWLDELTARSVTAIAFAFPLPMVVVSTLMRARAIAPASGTSARSAALEQRFSTDR